MLCRWLRPIVIVLKGKRILCKWDETTKQNNLIYKEIQPQSHAQPSNGHHLRRGSTGLNINVFHLEKKNSAPSDFEECCHVGDWPWVRQTRALHLECLSTSYLRSQGIHFHLESIFHVNQKWSRSSHSPKNSKSTSIETALSSGHSATCLTWFRRPPCKRICSRFSHSTSPYDDNSQHPVRHSKISNSFLLPNVIIPLRFQFEKPLPDLKNSSNRNNLHS